MGLDEIDGLDLKNMLAAGTQRLAENKAFVDSLNVFPVPDGDTGTNIYLTLEAALREVEKVTGNAIDKVAAAAAFGSLMGARGNSGVIFSQLFRGFARSLEGKTRAGAQDVARALQDASDMAYKAVMKPVEGTMLTVAREIARAVLRACRDGRDLADCLRAGLAQGEAALAMTPEMLPALKEAGVVDAGGQGLVLFSAGAVAALEGVLGVALPGTAGATRSEQAQPQALAAVATAPAQATSGDACGGQGGPPTTGSLGAPLEFVYDVVLIVRGRDIPVEELRGDLASMGDCVLVVGGPEVAKVHVHTNDPGGVLTRCAVHGTLHDLAIANMEDQREEYLAGDGGRRLPEAKQAARPVEGPGSAAAVAEPSREPVRAGWTGLASAQQVRPGPQRRVAEKDVGVVAVCVGEGLAQILKSLGADTIVAGGQTMNPSIEELANAVSATPARTAVILPNNPNVILTAEKAREVSAKPVVVVPSRTIPQGVAALIAMNPELPAEVNCRNMTEALKGVRTGEITYAVRNSSYNGFAIDENDYIGLADGELVAAGKRCDEVALKLVAGMVGETSELITLYYGSETKPSDAALLAEQVSRAFPHCEVEVQYGGQPVYYYVISVE